MLHRKTNQRTSGFSSIFKTQSYLKNFNSLEKSPNKTLSDDNISECSSEPASEQENQISPIRISGYSSDENASDNKNSSNLTRNSSCFLHHSNKTSTAKKRRRRPLRKPLSKVKISREPKKLFATIEPKRVLTAFNSPTKNINHVTESPWNKVKSVFQILEDTPSRKCCNNSSELQPNGESQTSCVEKINEEQIEWSSTSSEASCETTQQGSQVISTPSTSSQASNPPTELDLLLALIERESNIAKRKSRINTKTSDKRCRKGGYLQELIRTLEAAKTDRKYLEHDKKFGLQSGTKLTVVKLETSFGVHFAIGQLEGQEDEQLVRILLDADLTKQVKVGSILEAFFNASFGAFTSSGWSGEEMPTYVQPHRLLLL